MFWLLIAGGIVFTPTPSQQPVAPVETVNHLLLGDPVPAKDVVTRNRWGTPMMPLGNGGYSLIQAYVEEYVKQSLIQPPKTDGPIFRPAGSQAKR